MSSNNDVIEQIPNGKPVRIFIPLKKTTERIRVQGLYQETTPPKFSLLFKPGVIPVKDLDLKQPCTVSVDMGGPTISLEAMIVAVSNNQKLDMIVKKSVNHEQMRDFFRVDAKTSVISKSFHTEYVGKDEEPWSVDGQTIDISGSGILAIFDNEVPAETQVTLEISIPPFGSETIKVVAHQVRSKQLEDGRYEIAYHFDDISSEDRDKIIGSCLIIQRQMLRLKVQVRG